MVPVKRFLDEIYRRLDAAYEDQRWWPGETPLEVAVGAVLTQNTAWTNVERAITNLKNAGMLDARKLARADAAVLAGLIRPAGYYNVKAARLGALLRFLDAEMDGKVEKLGGLGIAAARERLLAVKGIGPETADSILLYACGLPTFVVDAYTGRVLRRHGLAEADADYDQVKDLFEANLPADAQRFNQFHALFVRVGKERCKKRKPRCDGCPLDGVNGRSARDADD